MSNSNFSKNVRARFIQRGTTLTRWALDNGFSVKTAHKAVRGERKGPKAIAILNRIKAVL